VLFLAIAQFSALVLRKVLLALAAKFCIMADMADLLTDTKRLLTETELGIDEIAEGVGVSRRWIYMFQNDEIPNPGIVGVQKLHDFLIARSARGSGSGRRGPPAHA
jgi:hypothetical protein